jgi:hypothetical protein
MVLTYLALGVPRVATGDIQSAMVFLAMAAATLGVAVATLPIMAPRRRGGGEEPPGGNDLPGDGPPSPPWWPEFEREFWSRVDSGEAAPWSRPPAGGSGRPRERTPA